MSQPDRVGRKLNAKPADDPEAVAAGELARARVEHAVSTLNGVGALADIQAALDAFTAADEAHARRLAEEH